VPSQDRNRGRSETAKRGRPPSRELLVRFTLLGATLGLLVGLFEAALLFSTPRVPTLLEPDVRSVIWSLAPSLTSIIFGLAGLAVGWIAARGKHGSPRRNATLAAAMVGIVGAYVACVVNFLHVRTSQVLTLSTLLQKVFPSNLLSYFSHLPLTGE